jgi:hypothetical protein
MLAKVIYVVAGSAILDCPSLVSGTRSCVSKHPKGHFTHFARLVLVQQDLFSQNEDATGRIVIRDRWRTTGGLSIGSVTSKTSATQSD